MNFYEEIDKENEAAKKRWLQYSLFYFIGYPFLIFLMATFSIFFSRLDTAAWQAEVLNPGLTIILSLVSFGMTYYFAYKKIGIKWLTLILIIGPIGVIKSISGMIKMDLDIFEKSIMLIEFILFFGWYVLSWRLRKANMRKQLLKQFPEDSKSCMDILERSLSLEDLNANFHNLMQTFPKLEPIVLSVYQTKKNLLQLN